MKKIFLFFLLAFALVAQNADAQSKKVTKKKTTTSKSKDKKGDDGVNFWTEKMMYGSYINNPTFFNGYFNMALSPMIGYKVTPFLSAGVMANVDYSWFRGQFAQPPINLFDFGGGIFARVKVFNALLVHADYMVQNTTYDFDQSGAKVKPIKERTTPLNIGLGYIQGFSTWKYEIGLYYNASYNSNTNSTLNTTPFSVRAAITYNL